MEIKKHILIIRLSSLGDVAMTVPVVRALVYKYPEYRITFLTRHYYHALFREFKHINLFPLDLNNRHKGVMGLFRLSKDLKKLKFDAVIDLHNVLRTNILKILFNKSFYQIDKGRFEKFKLIKGINFKQLKTTHQRYLEVFENINVKLKLSNTDFPKKADLSKYKFLKKNDYTQKLIGIAPFAKYESKTYSLNLMKEVISDISKNHIVLLFGGKGKESEMLTIIARDNKNIINLSGKISLSNELDFISNLDLMVSMDSANGHLAAMLGIKVLTIWGVTHPYAGFAPFKQNSDNSIMVNRKSFPKIPSSVYGNRYPKNYKKAINNISPQKIIDKIKNLICTPL